MSAPYRDAQTEQVIADVWRSVETPDVMEQAAARVHAGMADGKFGAVFPLDDPQPRTVLTGESHEAYAEFTAAAQALEAHQRSATPVLERYKAALAKLSGIAARSGG